MPALEVGGLPRNYASKHLFLVCLSYARTANLPLFGPSPNGGRMLLLSEDVKYLARLVQPSGWASMKSSLRLSTADIPNPVE